MVPQSITPAYVNAVFAVLNHVYGDATRQLVASRSVTPAVEADLKAIFTPSLYAEQLQQAKASLKGPINNVKTNPGDGITTVLDLVSASSACIFAQTTTTLDNVLLHPVPAAASEYYELTRDQPGLDPGHLNPTPWIITFNAAYLTPTSIGDRCAG
ncbi:MAG TPA: hypothetical protein VFN68_06320 [Acidimicrobiales bacterium]|nr:hypothetical protein [Acidimicrobiales bacterium]